MSTIGHNSVAGEELKTIISRLEKLADEKSDIAETIKDVFTEAKGRGFDNATIRTILKLRKKDASEREEEENLLDTYMNAIGMLPLFERV